VTAQCRWWLTHRQLRSQAFKIDLFALGNAEGKRMSALEERWRQSELPIADPVAQQLHS
jgi:hypothetical protein